MSTAVDFLNFQDVAPKAIGVAAGRILKTHKARTNIMPFAASAMIDRNKGNTLYFREYEDLPIRTGVLEGGVNPEGEEPAFRDVVTQLVKLGSWVRFADEVYKMDPNEIDKHTQKKLNKQAHETIETYDWETLITGTNVAYSDGTSRAEVASVLDISILELVESIFADGRAEPFTELEPAGMVYGSQAVEKAFMVLFHSHLRADLRHLPGFTLVKDYGVQSSKVTDNEFGQWGPFKFLESILYVPFLGAGAVSSNTNLRRTGGRCDVYALVAFGVDSFGCTKLAGFKDIKVASGGPKESTSDPLGVQGFISWKTWHDIVITNDDWLCKIEVACSLRRNA